MFAHIDVRTESSPKCCVLIPALPFQEKIIIFIMQNVYFFKVRADARFYYKRLTKEESTERKTQERKQEREREKEREERKLIVSSSSSVSVAQFLLTV